MATRPDADLGLIRRAYDVAAAWHHGQTRFSGDPYITYPLAVATIPAGLGASGQVLCAALQAAGSQVLAIKVADRLHSMRTVEFLPPDNQLRKAAEARDVFVPAARLLHLDTVEPELDILAAATLSRDRHARTASGRLLTATAALLPPATRTRWRQEWLGELHTLPARRSRAAFRPLIRVHVAGHRYPGWVRTPRKAAPAHVTEIARYKRSA